MARTKECDGNSEGICCYLGKYGYCEFLETDTVEGRHWACGLRRELGSWEAVHADPRYESVREKLRDKGWEMDCGDWPPPGVDCLICGNIWQS